MAAQAKGWRAKDAPNQGIKRCALVANHAKDWQASKNSWLARNRLMVTVLIFAESHFLMVFDGGPENHELRNL
jgi:hypothetical protein